jgi:hypothetical protein
MSLKTCTHTTQEVHCLDFLRNMYVEVGTMKLERKDA